MIRSRAAAVGAFAAFALITRGLPARAQSSAPPATPSVAATARFAGQWVLAFRSRSAFGLVLQQDGDHITGHYCANSHGAERIDGCEVIAGQPPAIEGTITGRVAVVTFRSNFGTGPGRARLTLAHGQLFWEIIEEPPGEVWLLERAWMRRGRGWWPAAQSAAAR